MNESDTEGGPPEKAGAEQHASAPVAPAPFHLPPGAREAFAQTPDARAVLKPGDVLDDRFEIVRPLGRGAMGLVYRVADRLSPQPLALKVVFPSHAANPRTLERFLHEMDIARRLRHPGIVAIHEVRYADPLLFYTMDYLPGHTLRQFLEHFKRLPMGKATGLIYRLCLALEYAHQFTAHGNISPGNIMVMSDASVALLDFGVSKSLDAAMLARMEASLGRPFYLAPEQRQDPGAADARSDVFALGLIYFEMLAGDLPSGYNRLSALRPDLPKECDRVMAFALAPKDKRCKTVLEFRRAVEWCFEIYREEQQMKLAHQEAAQPAQPPPPASIPAEPPSPSVATPPSAPKEPAPPPETPEPAAARPEGPRVIPRPAKPRPKLVHSDAEQEWEEWEKQAQKKIYQPIVVDEHEGGGIADAFMRWLKKD